ncbi:MAG: signal peptidase I [Candidatus Kuenenbacteria bacterium]
MQFIQPPEERKPNFEPETDKDKVKSQFKSFIWETLKVIIVSLVIIVPVRYFIIQPFYVKGASMEPNFYDREYLIVDEISYRFDEPARGDVIVFKYLYDRSQYFIKRIIGLPGETVKLEDGKIMISDINNIDGFTLNEYKYLPNTHTQGVENIKLSADEYFIMGDNRSASLDSRMFGPIQKDDIVGKIWIRGWPFNKIKVFGREVYPLGLN